MPKIRGIKPEFWTDEKVVEVSPIARLLFIGLWTYACDNGHIEDRPRQIKLRVLPADTENVDALLAELHDVGLIERANGWISIPTLAEHQKPDKRYFVTCDFQGCRDAKPVVRTRQAPPPDPEEFPPDPLRDHDEPTPGPHRAHTVATRCLSTEGDGDGEGEGEGDNYLSSDADASAEIVEAEIVTGTATALALIDAPDMFEEWWGVYDKKVGKRKAQLKWKLALKKPGVTAGALILSARRYIEHQKSIGKHPQYTKNPETWLNGEHWDDALIQPSSNGRPVTAAALTEADWSRWMANAIAADEANERNAS